MGWQESESYPGSYYAASANPAPSRPPLRGEIEADVCVVGAGYSGLSAALTLAEAGRKVVMLEGARVGWGASGRNGGQIVNGLSRDLDEIAGRAGEAKAAEIGRMWREGGDIIRDRVARYGIQCDLKPGNIFAAFTPKQMKALEHRKALWARHGHDDTEMLDGAGIRRHVTTERYIGGFIDHSGGHMHPLNLALGEAAAVESLGGVIYENTRMLSIAQEGGKAVIRTADGLVRADQAVICGNAYLGDAAPELTAQVMPVSTQVIATEPLGERGRALLPTDICVEDCNYILDYYRLTGDGRLLFGGGSVYGGAHPDNIEAKIRPNLEKAFPGLRGVKVDFAWSGWFALTLTRLPQIGRIGQNIYFAHGYSGHGVTGSHLCGRLIGEAAQGDATRFDVFAGLPYLPFPGGRTFRVPLSVLGSWWYGLRDRLGV